jgi:pre-mRNA-splicing factor CWC22
MSASVGIYLPPFKLARLKEEQVDPHSEDYQRLEWERMRKSLKGMVNRVNASNIKSVVQELFTENLIKGRGLLVRSLLHAQIASPVFSNVFAALVSVVNTRIPEIGDLLVRRLVLQFRRAYSRSDEVLLSCVCKFLAHLFNQRVISEQVILQVVTIFLERMSSDSVKICCQLLFECGAALSTLSTKGTFFVFERLRHILQENLVDSRVQYTIESLFEARRNKFVAYPAIIPDLDLVDESDKVTHEVDVIEGEIDGEETLNIFKAVDPQTDAQEAENWRSVSQEILGVSDDVGQYEEEIEEEEIKLEAEKAIERISDMTEQDTINLKKTIYLAIMSSANFEESVHKILSLNLRQGQEREVVVMLVDSAAMEKTTSQFFHLQSERLCRLSRAYKECFEDAFGMIYEAMHRYETPKIRNIAKLFSHLLFTGTIAWDVMRCIRLTEEDTLSSTRIFLKVLFQDLVENMGTANLAQRMRGDEFGGVLITDSVQHMRFCINFFTAVGLSPLIADLRERMNEEMLRAEAEIKRSRSPERPRKRSYSRSIPRENLTVIKHSPSPSRRRRRSRSRSRSVDSYGRRRRTHRR